MLTYKSEKEPKYPTNSKMFQACCSISVYLVTVIFFYGVEGYIDSPIISFYMSTFLWEIVHMIDG